MRNGIEKEDRESIPIYKSEKKGIWTILIIYFVSWGILGRSIITENVLIIFRNNPFGFISWLAMGLIGFSMWRVMDGLLERAKGGLN